MKKINQQLCACCGIICSFFWLGGIILADFLPPPQPGMDAETIAAIYRTDTALKLAGFIILGFGSVLYVPWTAAITAQMKRIEGSHTPLAYTNLGTGSIFVWVFFLPVMIWIAAAYRADETPAFMLLRMNDFGWLSFINPVAVVFIQGIVIGLCVLQDDNDNKLFPRWLGYFNIWAMVMFLPGCLIPFFKDGVFAWDGLLALWIPLVIFVAWMVIMSLYLLKAINTQEEFRNV